MAGFTGEHVGEPLLIITLVGPPLLHVDFKVARRVGELPRGVRHLEFIAPNEARALRATVCGYDRHEAGRALLACVELYRR
ncbi:hypothetical protein [Streptomyces sp. CBMA152]|uniref:hypothetical protein n=1 Tax=Streptomyces sp. CBMA152 TaxID=1896312 RepID=UPI001CB72B33|nr:hypothetical protein [Streptomyces sp. CBMA152]MBD0742863.1 hypothetical protein [Streptomyces sp. CBMA152]